MAKAKKTASGNWRVLIYTGRGIDGKRHYKSFTAPTKTDAEFAALEWQRKRPTVADMTLRQAYNAYIEDRDAVLSESTLKEYERIARSSDSIIMEKKISDITLNDAQREVNRLSRTLSAKSVKNRYGLFTAVMKQYRPDAIFHAKLPQKKKTDIFIPDENEIVRLYAILRGQRHVLIVPFLLGSQLGLRASEIAGLTFGAIDYAHRRVRICQALVAGRGGQKMKLPKSVSGDRLVPCSQEVLDEIGTGKPDERVVPYSAHYISTLWHRFMLSTDEEYFSFHKLRHFFCSRALLAGIPKRYVADYMGHASEDMVNKVYEHVFPSARESFAEKLTQTALFLPNATENATDKTENP